MKARIRKVGAHWLVLLAVPDRFNGGVQHFVVGQCARWDVALAFAFKALDRARA